MCNYRNIHITYMAYPQYLTAIQYSQYSKQKISLEVAGNIEVYN